MPWHALKSHHLALASQALFGSGLWLRPIPGAEVCDYLPTQGSSRRDSRTSREINRAHEPKPACGTWRGQDRVVSVANGIIINFSQLLLI